MINGRTQLVGLIGWPVEHSLSPAMHNAAFDALEMNWRYVALPVRRDDLDAAVHGVAALGFRGCNVTVPHKTAAGSRVARSSEEARAAGAVNTLVIDRQGSRWNVTGHNTDCGGFLDGLVQAGVDPRGRRTVIVGAGGAARAATVALLRAGASHITLLARDPERAERTANAVSRNSERITAGVLSERGLVRTVRRCSLLVNATPVGMWPDDDASVWPDGVRFPNRTVVYDLVYAPRRTKLLRQAAEAGAKGLGGLDMLVGQGGRSFELWTGCAPPLDVMRTACEAAWGET